MGGIYSGIVTVTEAAGLAVLVAMMLAIFVYKNVKVSETFSICAEGMKLAGMVLIILASAVVFGHWITHAGIAAKVVNFVEQLNVTPAVFLIFASAMYFVLGCFLEGTSMLLITIPILFPITSKLGIDPIHFGVVAVLNIEIAGITPPIGLNLFVLEGISKIGLQNVIRGAFPFVILGFVELASIIIWPWFCTFIPNLVMPGY
jgi:C4-dicarboxylate transporter DctM subunit